MSRSDDTCFVLAVSVGRVDLTDQGVAAHPAVMKARHLGDDSLRPDSIARERRKRETKRKKRRARES